MQNWGKRVGRGLLCAVLALGISCGSIAYALTTGVVNSQSGLRLRSTASTSSSTIATVAYGTVVEVLSTQDGWCYVSVNGQTGYMAQEYLNITSTDCTMVGTVNVTAVNMRAAASTSSSILALLSKGECVTVKGVEGKWSCVTYNTATGFIYSEYLSYSSSDSETAAPQTAVTQSAETQPADTRYITGYGVNFRAEASTSSEIYEVLPFGTAVAFVETLDSWTKVTYNGRTGYVYSQYLGTTPNTLESQIIAKAAEYLGTPYVYGGMSPSGFDCSGLTKYVFSFFDIPLCRSANAQISDGTKISQNELRPGDLVFFSEGNTGYATHVGLYTGNGNFIHASNRGVVYNNLTDPYYCDYYLCAVRVL